MITIAYNHILFIFSNPSFTLDMNSKTLIASPFVIITVRNIQRIIVFIKCCKEY